MKTTVKASKKITAIVLTVVMLFSLICVAGTVSAGAATSQVSLYSAAPIFQKYGMTTYEVYIQTKVNANNQKVYVHYNYVNYEPWRDVEAQYFTTLDDGSKIWKATFTSINTKYCIKYVADGVTYWDNNNGRDYTYGNSIGSAPVFAERIGYQYSYQSFTVNALLQNYAYHKNVFVRYTTDGWNSCHDFAMSYSSTKEDGTEEWTANLPISAYDTYIGNFQYAICYQVNGREYWANNFGANFDGYYYIHK